MAGGLFDDPIIMFALQQHLARRKEAQEKAAFAEGLAGLEGLLGGMGPSDDPARLITGLSRMFQTQRGLTPELAGRLLTTGMGLFGAKREAAGQTQEAKALGEQGLGFARRLNLAPPPVLAGGGEVQPGFAELPTALQGPATPESLAARRVAVRDLGEQEQRRYGEEEFGRRQLVEEEFAKGREARGEARILRGEERHRTEAQRIADQEAALISEVHGRISKAREFGPGFTAELAASIQSRGDVDPRARSAVVAKLDDMVERERSRKLQAGQREEQRLREGISDGLHLLSGMAKRAKKSDLASSMAKLLAGAQQPGRAGAASALDFLASPEGESLILDLPEKDKGAFTTILQQNVIRNALRLMDPDVLRKSLEVGGLGDYLKSSSGPVAEIMRQEIAERTGVLVSVEPSFQGLPGMEGPTVTPYEAPGAPPDPYSILERKVEADMRTAPDPYTALQSNIRELERSAVSPEDKARVRDYKRRLVAKFRPLLGEGTEQEIEERTLVKRARPELPEFGPEGEIEPTELALGMQQALGEGSRRERGAEARATRERREARQRELLAPPLEPSEPSKQMNLADWLEWLLRRGAR